MLPSGSLLASPTRRHEREMVPFSLLVVQRRGGEVSEASEVRRRKGGQIWMRAGRSSDCTDVILPTTSSCCG